MPEMSPDRWNRFSGDIADACSVISSGVGGLAERHNVYDATLIRLPR